MTEFLVQKIGTVAVAHVDIGTYSTQFTPGDNITRQLTDTLWPTKFMGSSKHMGSSQVHDG